MTKANKLEGLHSTYIPITKIDEENRLVFARLTDETVDLANEIMDYATSKPLFQAWSEQANKVTGGKSKGNLRAMHQPIAAGKFIEVNFDDVAKAIDTVSHVVDDNEWKKVQSGTYTGLSLGGNIVGKMWKDEATGAMRYTVKPVEGSLVDLPCNPSATFTHVKMGGVEVQEAFRPWQPDNNAVAVKAAELASVVPAEDADEPHDFIAEARNALIEERAAEAAKAAVEEPAPLADGAEAVAEVKAVPEAEHEAAPEGVTTDVTPPPADYEPHQKWIGVDGKAFDTKRECREHNDAIKALEAKGVPALKAALDAAKAAANPAAVEGDGGLGVTAEQMTALGKEAADLSKALTQAEKAADGKVEKGLWMVSDMARVLDALAGICASSAWEDQWNDQRDASVTNMIADSVSQLGATLLAMAQEEVANLITALQEQDVDIVEVIGSDYVELAAAVETVKANEALMTKAGARNSKKDAAAIQRLHDDAISLGATCSAEKAAGAPLEKIAELEITKAALEGQIAEAIPGIAELGETTKGLKAELAKANARIEELAKGPAPMPALQSGANVVSKSQDNGGAADNATVTADALKLLAASAEGRKMLLDAATDAALNSPRSVLP